MTTNVHHWDSDTIEEVEVPLIASTGRIRVLSETPLTADGVVLPRRGNRYWPTMVQVWLGAYIDGEELTETMLAEDARALGKALIRASITAERTDAPDSDKCGHWAPCGCGKVP